MVENDYIEVGDVRDLIRRVIREGKARAELVESTSALDADTSGMQEDEALAFWAVSMLVARLMRKYGLRGRNGTCFRLAVGIMDELSEADHCSDCMGQRALKGMPCPTCGGSGRKPMSTTWRKDRTLSRFNDFRDRVEAVYVRMLADVARVVGL